MERWERAKALGLSPPIEVCRFIIAFSCQATHGIVEVFEILSTKEGHEDEEYVQNVLYGEL